jgi:peptidoglycan/xylan/chitin deacetylase (PgdA/CDA1 family)
MRGLLPVVLALTLFAPGLAAAAECPGNPGALGTSRTVVVDPVEHPRLGVMQYHESLPLQDHEVVLTFDDGPLPPRTNHILDILASECVKATFFMVGRMALTYPDVARSVEAAGHTVGTHTQNHPLRLDKMPLINAEREINEGITSVTAALGEPPAPFLRIPGLARTNAIDHYLASQNLLTWSADFPADDWTRISPAQVYTRALQRIEANGKGILLLHDIQAKTVEALPDLLHELKRRGYHIVHVLPATPERPKTATEPSEWIVHAHGRQIGTGSFIEAVLPLPSQPSFGNNQPLDARPAVAAPVQRSGRPVLRPLQVLQLSGVLWPPGFSGSQAVLSTAHSLLPAPNPASFSYPETSFAPSFQGNTSLIVPPEPDALDMASPPLETGPPADSAAPQSSTAPPLLAPRDLVSTAKMPHGPFP